MKPTCIDINDFNYNLPNGKIAKYPLGVRSNSKLLYYNNKVIEHKKFNELSALLPINTMLVFNNTKVIEARLKFKTLAGCEIEIFLLHPANNENATTVLEFKEESLWKCMIGKKKKWKENESLILKTNTLILEAKWKDRENNIVCFKYSSSISLLETIQELGSLPIPPYLNRATEDIDYTRYQTTFATFNGSVAAPTAALHFDEKIYLNLKKHNIKCEYLTLHVGAGTFKPVSVVNAINHPMHKEYIIFSKNFIKNLLAHQGSIISVGTTSFRSLESLYWFGVGLEKGLLEKFNIEQYFPYNIKDDTIAVNKSLSNTLKWMDDKKLETLEGNSSIFIVPGYKSKIANGIITNFNQPKSTLLLLIASLVGNEWENIYVSAIENNYRFLSYGDSSLILF